MPADVEARGHHLTRSQVVALLDEVDTLRERVRQFEEALKPSVSLPREWRLSRYEEQLLMAVRAVGTNVLHKERAMIALYGMFDDETPDMKILDVHMCKLRRKLMEAQTQIVVESVWGRGWVMSADSLARLNKAVAAQSATFYQPGASLVIGPSASRRAG